MMPRPPAATHVPAPSAVPPDGRTAAGRDAAAPAPSSRGPNSAALGRGAAVVAAYVVLIVGFTWPLATHLGDRFILTYGIDLWQNLWNFAWVRTALADLHQSPYYTYSIFYPTGVPLVYHALNLFSAAVSIPLQAVWGLVPAFNLLLLGSLLAAALAAYWLARVLGLPRGAAFLAGLIFACGPTMSAAVNQGQSEQYSTFWMPLYAGLLIRGGGLRALGLPPGRRWYLAAAGLVLAASVFAIYYWFVALAVFTVIYVAMEGWGALRGAGRAALRPLGARLALLAAVTAVALIPLGVVLVQTQLQGGDSLVLYRSAGGDVLTISGSQDLLGFFVPLPNHVNPRGAVDGPGPRGSRYGLGWSVLLLAGVGVVAARRRVALWGVAALMLAVLALGPTLVVAGNVTSIPLPYAAILQIPGAAAMRAPDRFLVLLTLCTAILAAYGLAALGARLRPRGRAALLLLAALLVVVEFFDVPRTLVSAEVPEVYHQLAAQPSPCLGSLPSPPTGCGAVLELPDDADLPSMYDQAVDQHPLLGGYLSRHYPYWFTVDTPGVAELVASAPAGLQQADIVTPSARDVALQAMDYYGVRTVIVHPLDGYGHAAGLQATLHLLFGDAGQPEDGLTVYTVPHAAQDRAFLFLGDAWYAAEHLPDGGVQRWTDQRATIHVVAPVAGAGAYTLTLQVYAAGGPRTLVASLDGQEIAREAVGLPPGVTLHLPLQLAAGAHTLTLASVEPAIQPAHDPRTISLGYQQITLERAP